MIHFIRIGEIGIGGKTDCLKTFVGSCVAIVLHDPANHTAALAHVQLPASTEHSTIDMGRYADTAIPELVRQLQSRSRTTISPLAHIAGGADMFPVTQSRSVGQLNTAAIKELLSSHRIPILSENCGGSRARRITFEIKTGNLQIDLIEPPPIVTKTLGVKL